MNLKELRERAGLTQLQIAQCLGVDPGAVCRWESGKTMPRSAKLPELAKLLRCSIDALYGREQPNGHDPAEQESA